MTSSQGLLLRCSCAQIEWPEFAVALAEQLNKNEEDDVQEGGYKETFRVFSKDNAGCIPAEEMKFVLSQGSASHIQICSALSPV